MTNLRVMQSPDEYLCFAVFDSTTNQLLYSKYNFNFDLYGSDFDCSELSKNQMFYNFFNRNETDLWNPFSVKPELTEKELRQISLKPSQANYLQKIMSSDITLCYGPAGTSKTFTACLAALKL